MNTDTPTAQLPAAPVPIPLSQANPAEQLPTVSDPRVFIGCPAYGSLIHVPFTVSLFQCLQNLKCIGDLRFFGGD